MNISRRFAGYLPVVVDCETGGVDPQNDALLEIAATILKPDGKYIAPGETLHYHVEAFPGGAISDEALSVNQIRPDHPFRFALPESDCLVDMADKIRAQCQEYRCRRAVLVGHNAHFDLAFLLAAYQRCDAMKLFPFHRFMVLDTVTLGATFVQETVLARAVRRAGLSFDIDQAHSALYDVDRTAALFCHLINKHTSR
ncbi:MAG: ribonuclease T [Legionellales bacterium]|jgi:ribonuclease T|nr:ribonuclease T [Legionellales bacterium]